MIKGKSYFKTYPEMNSLIHDGESYNSVYVTEFLENYPYGRAWLQVRGCPGQVMDFLFFLLLFKHP